MATTPTPKAEAAAPSPDRGRLIVLFDGECVLCNGWARFIAARDPQCQFALGALQSPAGVRLRAERGIESDLSSILLITPRSWATKSDAVLRILARLSAPWSLAAVFVAVPGPLRDWVYDFIAARRYRWFGKVETCPIPTPEMRARLLPDG
jgi:predicted DCC family thiol-disulfide oxidoreductase YuxK